MVRAKALLSISFALNAPEFKPRSLTPEATWTTVWIGVGSGDGRGDGTIVGTGEGAAVVGDGGAQLERGTRARIAGCEPLGRHLDLEA